MRKLLTAAVAAFLLVGQPLAPSLSPPPAEAAVSIAYTLEELVMQSPRVILATATERSSRWEEVAGSNRIVTYTKLVVHADVYGGGDAELWVRTLGGVVGKIGQQVSGEASFPIGEKALVFLTRSTDGVWLVTGMAQGHYPVRVAEKKKESDPDEPERLAYSPGVGAVIPRRGPSIPAHQRLVGKTVSESLTAIRAAKAEVDAREKK